MAVDRADDLGSEFPSDANETSPPPDPITNRSQSDFLTGPDPVASKVDVPEDADVDFTSVEARRYRVKTVLDETLSCRLLVGSIETGGPVLIAKPDCFRKSFYDGETIEGVLYTAVDAQTRTGLFNTVTEQETIEPAYVTDKSVIYAIQPVNGTGIDGAALVDANSGGRTWFRPVERQALVRSIQDDLLTVEFYDGNLVDSRTLVGNGTFQIARPNEHRVTEWDGETFGGFTYTKISAIERSATDGSNPENHKITPPYRVDASVILIKRITNPGDFVKESGNLFHWIDSNNDSRAWAVDPDA